MKKTSLLIAIAIMVFSLLFTSCGPSKKLLDSEARVNKLQKENAEKISKIDELDKQVADLNKDKSFLQNENFVINNNLKSLSTDSKITIADQAKRLKNLQNMIQTQKDVMSKLKNLISEALMNFKADEIYVDIKDGKVYVSLEEKLLFKSGSAVVDTKGKEALKSLAKVLNSTKDITVMIEGHTDDVPIKTKQFEDNWALSTARANTILRLLTKEYGFDSKCITASGRGEFHPVKTNETKEGRSSNRRTEVILSPDLKELNKLLYE
ncbi:MAG: hypothetical protein A2275_07555 [Bacteroidetes bacterium RIFOXYA12_FULL_35_11]|nr:MAG: hypothetical protein A2X01_00775 [Bacteroidetes bacterium GWF2_35_48]OFY80785.1 MAG: hypothetical protein A2275_07555 [Bacteroidetes bacterium RIFOXYA12_FULL_35_11]OFY94790.1 MAG: hypothetical protein A2309_12905 [Bacteroidetes bacterium RIFOXYB2_FULL_35_7]OFZ04657.1 MAG: hypothetical protein A2491_11610 [Bacteroidetes bacterium RIFOXYC12_FULL_35_7]HBX50067.1 flagellar motor protein MotB [Bacteroidales bacterium]